MGKVHELSVASRVGARAIESGGSRKSLAHVDVEWAGGCISPKTVVVEGRSQEGRDGKVTGFLGVEMKVRCRKCPACLLARMYQWRERARFEHRNSQRTWFGTLTLSPERHAEVGYRVREKLRRSGVDWTELGEDETFVRLHREISKEIIKYLKRIRRKSGVSIRFMVVAEKHHLKLKGLPHYHFLLHEAVGSARVTERELRKQWKMGFSKFNLVEDDDEVDAKKRISYVCKYLTKDAARVRASLWYGRLKPSEACRMPTPALPKRPIPAAGGVRALEAGGTDQCQK